MKIEFLNCSHGPRYQPLGDSIERELRLIKSSNAEIAVNVCFEQRHFEGVDPKLAKLALVLERLESADLSHGDWIVWVDSDVSIVDKGMDPLTLLPSNKELVFSSDKFGICTGVFGAKKSQWTLGVFKAVVLLGQTDRERSKEFDLFDYRAEQFVFRALLRYFPDVRAHCHVFDESVVQNRMSNYAPKAWMFHFWMGGRSASEILRKKQALSENEWSCEAFWEAGRYDLQTSKDIAHVAKKIGIEAKRLAFLVGLSEDFEKSPIRSLGLDESDRLIRISNLGDEAFQLFGDAMIARQWLSTQLPSLNDNEPIDLCVSATGYDQAIDALEKTTRKGPRKDALKGS